MIPIDLSAVDVRAAAFAAIQAELDKIEAQSPPQEEAPPERIDSGMVSAKLGYWVSPMRKGMASLPDGTRYAAWIVDVAPSKKDKRHRVTCATSVTVTKDEAAKYLAVQAVKAAQTFTTTRQE